jgi:hypothetical protein
MIFKFQDAQGKLFLLHLLHHTEKEKHPTTAQDAIISSMLEMNILRTTGKNILL